MSRQDQSEAPRDYGCLSHAVGASAARQRGEVVRDDNSQTSRLEYQDAEVAGMPCSGSRDDDGGVFADRIDGGLPQAKPGGSVRGRERGYGCDKYQGEHGAGVPYGPLATIRAGAARVEGRPRGQPYCDGGEELTGSNDSPAPTKTSHGDCWQWQRCNPGNGTPELGTEVPGDFPAAANASGPREAGQPGDGIHCDDSERLAGSGLPRSRSGGDGCWQGRGCSGGRSAVEPGMQDCGDHTAATHAGVSREAGRPGDGIHCDDSARLTRSGPPRSRSGGDGCWQGRGCSGGRSAAELGTEVIDGPKAATHTREAVVHTNQGTGLRPCSPSAMRARLGGVRQPQGCNSGKSGVELSKAVPGSPPVAGEDDFAGEVCADVEELVEWWQDQEKGWDSDTVLDEWDSVRTGDSFTEVHATVFFPESADGRPLDPEGQLLVWDRHVLLRDLQGAVHQVPVQMDRDCRQFAAWCPDRLENVIFIAGATVLVRNVSLRDLGVIPGMLLEMRARLTGGAGDSHPMAALAVFRVQKYETWREYLAGSPTTAGALTRAIEKMIGRFAGDLPSLLTNISVTCPGLEPEHMWTLPGCFETYAGALLDFSVMQYVQVRREEYHDPEDWDALQEARREYDEVEHQVRLEGAHRKEQDEHLRALDSSDEEESPYEVLNLENVRKIRKRPGAPKWTVRLSKALRDYLQQPERVEEHSLANAIWEVMRKMDRQGSAYLKEEWKKKHKKEKKKRRKERKKAKKAGHKGKKGKGRKSKDTDSSSGSSSESSTSSDSSSSSQSSGKSGRQKATQPASAGRKGKVEIRVVDGRREFWSKKSQWWIDCTNPPEVPCPKCGQRHWYHEAEAFGCGA